MLMGHTQPLLYLWKVPPWETTINLHARTGMISPSKVSSVPWTALASPHRHNRTEVALCINMDQQCLAKWILFNSGKLWKAADKTA